MKIRELREMINRLDPELEVVAAPELLIPWGDREGNVSTLDFDNTFSVVNVIVGGKVEMYPLLEQKAIVVFDFKPRRANFGEVSADEPPPS